VSGQLCLDGQSSSFEASHDKGAIVWCGGRHWLKRDPTSQCVTMASRSNMFVFTSIVVSCFAVFQMNGNAHLSSHPIHLNLACLSWEIYG